MWALGVTLLVLGGACYSGPAAELSCKIRCSDGCPASMTCVQGYCAASGVTCDGADAAVDTRATCGEVGMACCSGESACVTNGYCATGTCQQCVVDVGLGRRHSCAIKSDGTVWCSGENTSGELGNGALSAYSTTRVQVVDAAGPITDATAVAAGAFHTCVVRTGGRVWCWGLGTSGQLGNNLYTTTALAVPVETIAGVALTGMTRVGAGYDYSCAHDGATIWCWGANIYGQLGDATASGRGRAAEVLDGSTFQPFAGWTEFSTGTFHACVLKQGNAWCWGRNAGRIGDGGSTDRYTPLMTIAANVVSAGRRHTCAIKPDTTVACTGGNERGWIGDGTGVSTSSHVSVLTQIGGSPFQAVALATGAVSCAIAMDRSTYCWGHNSHGQASGGGGPFPFAVTMVDGTPLTDVDRLVAGFTHVCAQRATGELLCWGNNTDGDLGDGTRDNHGFPTPIGVTCP